MNLPPSVVRKYTRFPKSGSVLGGLDIKEATLDMENGTWFVMFNGKVSRSQARKAMSHFIDRTATVPTNTRSFSSPRVVPVKLMCDEVTTVRSNPSGRVTIAKGHLSFDGVLKNPVSVSDFTKEMNDMVTHNPHKVFREFPYKRLNDKKFLEQLWSFVSFSGESYGWATSNGKVFHRRASLIMPKIKINKRPDNEVAFYHTHPSKDEPSLTSADDIQFYADLAFAPGVKHNYTVMRDRIDYFRFDVKKKKVDEYLDIDEGHFIDDVDAMIEQAEMKYKDDDSLGPVEYCNLVTAEMVRMFNDKYKGLMKITYQHFVNPKYKKGDEGPLANPLPNPTRPTIPGKYHHHSLTDLQGVDYDFVHYGGDEFAHTLYVYYWLSHHFEPDSRGISRLWKLESLGFDSELRKKTRAYLNQRITANWSFLDLLYTVALYHDIGKVREKDGEHHSLEGKYMWDEFIADALDVPHAFEEIVSLMLESDVGRRNISDDFFQTQVGEYYGVALIMQMAHIVTHHPHMFTDYAKQARNSTQFKGDGRAYKEWAMSGLVKKLKKFLEKPLPNPRPSMMFINWQGDYGTKEISSALVGASFEQFTDNPDGVFRERQGGSTAYFKFNTDTLPALTGMIPDGVDVSVRLIPATSSLWVSIKREHQVDDFGAEVAQTIYEEVGEILKGFDDRIVIDKVETAIRINPRKAKKVGLVIVSGPTGSGKSTLIRHMTEKFEVAGEPIKVTSRPRRSREKDGVDAIFTSKAEFEQMIESDQFVEWALRENGHYYGRRWVDFNYPVNVISADLKGVKAYKKVFPQAYTIFLKPDVSGKEMVQRIMRRGGMSLEEAKKQAEEGAAQVAEAKSIPFDQFVTVKSGSYEQLFDKMAKSMGNILTNPRVHESKILAAVPEPLAPSNLRGEILPLEQEYVQQRNAQIEFNRNAVRMVDAGTHVAFQGGPQTKFPEGSVIAPQSVRALAEYRQKLGSKKPFAPPPVFALVPVEHAAELEETESRTTLLGFMSNPQPPQEDDLAIVIMPDYLDNEDRQLPPPPPPAKRQLPPPPPPPPSLERYVRSFDEKAEAFDFAQTSANKLGQTMVVRYSSNTYIDAAGQVREVGAKVVPYTVSPVSLGYPLGSTENTFIEPEAKANPPEGLRLKDVTISVDYANLLDNIAWRFAGSPPANFNASKATQKQKDIIARRKKRFRELLAGWGYTGVSPAKAAEHIFQEHLKKFRGERVKVYRAMFTSEPPEILDELWNKYGVGLYWSNARVGADQFGGAASRQFKFHPSSRIAFLMGTVPFGDVNWFGTLLANVTFGVAESEVRMFPDSTVKVDKVEFYKLDQKARKKYLGLEGLDGRYQKPWTDPAVKPVDVWNVNESYFAFFSPKESLDDDDEFENPKDLFDWFEEWVHLINMKNKELKSFLDSPLGKKAGLSKQQAKDWNNIKSGRVSGRRILKMRAKLGLTGPKDYIKPGPRIIEDYYEKALSKWTGPSDDPLKGETDWDWCKRQVRFVKRTSAFPYNPNAEERKGPLVRAQKTQSKPSRRLLSLWVWGHDPWRWARKNGYERMSPCPDVPWVGMTEKRKWGKTEVKMNPTSDDEHQETLEKTGFWGSQGAGSLVVAKKTGRYLLPLRSQHVEQPGTWGVWGGAIDSGEVPVEAARRELTEEAGYRGPIEMVPLVVFESGTFRYHNFLAVVEDEFEPTLNWETERAQWFALDDFPQPLHFGLQYLLENSEVRPNPPDGPEKSHTAGYTKANPPKKMLKAPDLAARAINSVLKKNLIGSGAFGTVFNIPGTDFVFKVDRNTSPEYYREMKKWLAGKEGSSKPAFPSTHTIVHKYPPWPKSASELFGFPLYGLGDGKVERYHTIMKRLDAEPLPDLLPVGSSLWRGMEKPHLQMKQTIQYLSKVSKFKQPAFDRFVKAYLDVVGMGLTPDRNPANFLVGDKSMHLIDWWWEDGPRGKGNKYFDSESLEQLSGAVAMNNMRFRLDAARKGLLSQRDPDKRRYKTTWKQWEQANAEYNRAYPMLETVIEKFMKAVKNNRTELGGMTKLAPAKEVGLWRESHAVHVLWTLRPLMIGARGTAAYWKKLKKQEKKKPQQQEPPDSMPEIMDISLGAHDWGLKEVGQAALANPTFVDEKFGDPAHGYWNYERIHQFEESHVAKLKGGVGLFVGAYGDEEHIGRMARKLDKVIVIDPAFVVPGQEFDEAAFRQHASSPELLALPISLKQYLDRFRDTLALVHFPHQVTESHNPELHQELVSEIPRLLTRTHSKTVFSNIEPKMLPEGADFTYHEKPNEFAHLFAKKPTVPADPDWSGEEFDLELNPPHDLSTLDGITKAMDELFGGRSDYNQIYRQLSTEQSEHNLDYIREHLLETMDRILSSPRLIRSIPKAQRAEEIMRALRALEAEKPQAIRPDWEADFHSSMFDSNTTNIMYDPRRNPWFPSDASYAPGLTDQTISITQLSNPSKPHPGTITPAHVRSRPDTLFVFGDNDQRKGKKGQAIIRDEPNAIGFRTKKSPSRFASAYYTDDEYSENIRKMKEDLEEISARSLKFDNVYFIPGIGEGLAKLEEKAPRTYAWMKKNLPTDPLEDEIKELRSEIVDYFKMWVKVSQFEHAEVDLNSLDVEPSNSNQRKHLRLAKKLVSLIDKHGYEDFKAAFNDGMKSIELPTRVNTMLTRDVRFRIFNPFGEEGTEDYRTDEEGTQWIDASEWYESEDSVWLYRESGKGQWEYYEPELLKPVTLKRFPKPKRTARLDPVAPNPPSPFLKIPAEKVRDYYAEALPRPLLMKTNVSTRMGQSMEEIEGKMFPDVQYEAYKVARGDLPFFEQYRPLIAQTKEYLERVHGVGIEVVFVQEEMNEVNIERMGFRWSPIGNIYFREMGDDFGGDDPFEPGLPIKVTPFVSFDSGFMDSMANPPRPIPEFGYHFTHKNNLNSIMQKGLTADFNFLFYPDAPYQAWVMGGQIDGMFFDTGKRDRMPTREEYEEAVANMVMLKVKVDPEKFRPVPYEVGVLHEEFIIEGNIMPWNIEYVGTYEDTIVQDVRSGRWTEADIEAWGKTWSMGAIPDSNKIIDGTFSPPGDKRKIKWFDEWRKSEHPKIIARLKEDDDDEGSGFDSLGSLFSNPRTPGGKKFPKRYLTGLTKLEKMIAEDEIDKGYKYDVNDPEAYKFWKSDIKATARGLKIGPSKHKEEYYRRYRKNINKDYKPSGSSSKQKFLNRIRKETGIKKSILEKIYDKGLAAWRVGHRPGVQQHQWAAGRVYAFVVGADSSTGPGKPDNKLAVEAGVR